MQERKTAGTMEAILAFFRRGMWEVSREESPITLYFIGKTLQWVQALAREMQAGGLTLRAMGLVYTTLLSLVPLLAVSFSVLKAFGVHNQIEPMLAQLLAPLGAAGAEVTANIIRFVGNMKVGVLGFVGFVVLFYTVISLLEKIEDTFNHIWRTRRTRSFMRRFSDYLSVIMIGPVLVFSAIGLTATMTSHSLVQKIIAVEPFGTAFYLAGIVVPYILLIAAFTFSYLFICTAKVQFRAALAGGVFAGVGWKAAGWAFAAFVAGSTQYAAIYSSLAIIIIFMIWIYVSWLIVLLGGQVAFFWQHPQYVRAMVRHPRLSNRLKERVGLLVMLLIGRHFLEGRGPWSLQQLNRRLNLPVEIVREIIQVLQRAELIAAIGEGESYMPARDPDVITVAEILAAVRRAGEEKLAVDEKALSAASVERVLSELERAQEDLMAQVSLRDLVKCGESSIASNSQGTQAMKNALRG